MSFLTGPRLAFKGTFIADVSTVNNFPQNYRDEDDSHHYRRFTAADYADWKIGYWNPYGTGVWRLTDCAVTGAVLADGSSVTADDPVLSMIVADADDRPPAKLVDLDPQQQMVSAIWGLLVRLASRSGVEAVRGSFDVASFTDLWRRSWTQASDLPYPLHPPAFFGACWQSVLTDLAWGDPSGSAFLKQLQAAAGDGLLSIKINVHGFNAGYGEPNGHQEPPPGFTTGLLTGSIGVAHRDEPRFFTLGRKLQPAAVVDNSAPAFNYCTAAVDAGSKRLSVDLGNSIPFTMWRGPLLADTYDIGYFNDNGNFLPLGSVTTGTEWYERSAGVVDLSLSDAQMSLIASAPLAVRCTSCGSIVASEPTDGKFLRADQFVFRMSPGDQPQVALWATEFGRPLANAAVGVVFDNSGLQQGDDKDPSPGVPTEAVKFPAALTTDKDGRAALTLSAADPGAPRARIDLDGQVYGIRASLPGAGYTNPWDFVSLLVWDDYQAPQVPTWEADVVPILVQYANLYPIMLPVLDMGDFDSVMKHLVSLQHAMALPEEDPNYMPAVRDLSPAKRTMILRWASDPVRGEKAARARPAAAPSTGTAAVSAPRATHPANRMTK